MKKVLITLLAAILGLSFIFTGCSESYKTFSSEEELEAYIEDAVNAKISDKQSQNDDSMENTKESNKTVETNESSETTWDYPSQKYVILSFIATGCATITDINYGTDGYPTLCRFDCYCPSCGKKLYHGSNSNGKSNGSVKCYDCERTQC